MSYLLRVMLLGTILTLVPFPGAPTSQSAGLSPRDRQLGWVATRLAGRSMKGALQWLDRQREVRQARGDGGGIDVRFQDGARLVILPRSVSQNSFLPELIPLAHRADSKAIAPAARAIILEPFAAEISDEQSREQNEVADLTRAGFAVDVLRNKDVTISALEKLASYSVVYMETHSNNWSAGDAIIMTDETDDSQYIPLLRDGSVIQTTIGGQTQQVYYNAVTSTFFSRHLGSFPNGSILFFNGCALLPATKFWQALQDRNVATLISWDEVTLDSTAEPAAEFLLARLSRGDTVAAGIAATRATGLGTSTSGGKVAHLGFLGDGQSTLAKAVAGASNAVRFAIPATTRSRIVDAAPTDTPVPIPTVTVHQPKTPTATPIAFSP